MCCAVCALNAHQRFVNQHAALVDMKAQILHSTERLGLHQTFQVMGLADGQTERQSDKGTGQIQST